MTGTFVNELAYNQTHPKEWPLIRPEPPSNISTHFDVRTITLKLFIANLGPFLAITNARRIETLVENWPWRKNRTAWGFSDQPFGKPASV